MSGEDRDADWLLGLAQARAQEILHLLQDYEDGEIDLNGALKTMEQIRAAAQAIVGGPEEDEEPGGDMSGGDRDADWQWRPIDSAPRDGTHILCFIPASPPSEPWLIYVLRHRTVWQEADGEQWARYEPTHWMPLPAPPSDAEPAGPDE